MATKIFRYTGYTLFGCSVFIFFTYLNFPYYKLKDSIFLQIEKETGFKIDSDEIKTLWTFGLRLTDLEISHKNWNFPPVKLEDLTLSPSLFSLMIFQPKVSFAMGIPDGDIHGFFQQRSQKSEHVLLSVSDLPLKNKAWKEKMDLDLSGTLNANINLIGNLQTLSTIDGLTEIDIKKFILGKTTFLNMGIPQLSISNILVRGQFKNGKFVIEKIDVGKTSDDIEAHGTGDILLNATQIMNSRLNIKIKFKISEKLKEEFSLFLPFLAGALKPDGFYALDIQGSLGAPAAGPQRL